MSDCLTTEQNLTIIYDESSEDSKQSTGDSISWDECSMCKNKSVSYKQYQSFLEALIKKHCSNWPEAKISSLLYDADEDCKFQIDSLFYYNQNKYDLGIQRIKLVKFKEVMHYLLEKGNDKYESTLLVSLSFKLFSLEILKYELILIDKWENAFIGLVRNFCRFFP